MPSLRLTPDEAWQVIANSPRNPHHAAPRRYACDAAGVVVVDQDGGGDWSIAPRTPSGTKKISRIRLPVRSA